MDLTQVGTVSGTVSGTPYSNTDSCTGEQVHEYYCGTGLDGPLPFSTDLSCPANNACYGGRCCYSDAYLCFSNGWNCGQHTVTDNCGNSRTIHCAYSGGTWRDACAFDQNSVCVSGVCYCPSIVSANWVSSTGSSTVFTCTVDYGTVAYANSMSGYIDNGLHPCGTPSKSGNVFTFTCSGDFTSGSHTAYCDYAQESMMNCDDMGATHTDSGSVGFGSCTCPESDPYAVYCQQIINDSCGDMCLEGLYCPGDKLCFGSGCRCDQTTTNCPSGSDTCVATSSFQSDNNNCGSCGNVCGANMHCSSGSCVCDSGMSLCSGQCVDTDTDPDNCGSCGNSCGSYPACVDVSCNAGSCSATPNNANCPADTGWGSCTPSPAGSCTGNQTSDDYSCDLYAGCGFTRYTRTCNVTAGTVCSASTGVCQNNATCDGTGSTCPAKTYKSNATACRSAASVCDVTEYCTGSSASCPSDSRRPSGYVCDASSGICQNDALCDGFSLGCPAKTYKSSATRCRESAYACDLSEYCTGASASCPSDVAPAPGFTCNAATGICSNQTNLGMVRINNAAINQSTDYCILGSCTSVSMAVTAPLLYSPLILYCPA